jgi:hypothetical protein
VAPLPAAPPLLAAGIGVMGFAAGGARRPLRRGLNRRRRSDRFHVAEPRPSVVAEDAGRSLSIGDRQIPRKINCPLTISPECWDLVPAIDEARLWSRFN